MGESNSGSFIMDHVLQQIREISGRYPWQKVVLFGSRARGDYSAVSDYDIAVFGNNMTETDKTAFYFDIEEIATLKKIDIVFIDDAVSPKLLANISEEGVCIYGGTGS